MSEIAELDDSDDSAHAAEDPSWIDGSIFLAILVGLHVVAWLLAARPSMFANHFAADVPRMTEIVGADGWPWRDHPVEYPPVTWALVQLVVGSDNGVTIWRLATSQFIADLATAGALWWGWGRRSAVIYLTAMLGLLAYPFVLVRTDLTAVALVMWGLAAARRRSSAAAAPLLVAAVAAKVWPFVILPALAIRRRWHALGATIALGTVSALAWVAAVGTDAIVQVVTFRGSTGVHIESIPGVIASWTGRADERMEQGAIRIGDLPGWVLSGFTVLALCAVASIWWATTRRDHRGAVPEGLAELGAVCALLSCAALLSTQYIVWPVPFAAIAAADLWRRWGWPEAWRREPAAVAAVAMVLLAVPLSTLVYLSLPDIGAGHQPGLALLTLRNGLLVGATVAVGRALLAEPRHDARTRNE